MILILVVIVKKNISEKKLQDFAGSNVKCLKIVTMISVAY
jgi:hypothetical protein